MSSDIPSPSEFDAVRRIDSLCDQYEAALRAGEPARIEDLLDQVAVHERRTLLAELLNVEVELARRRQQPLELADYLARFGEFADIVLRILAESVADHSVTPPPPAVGALSGVSGPPGDVSGTGGGRFQPLRPHAQGGLGRIWVALDAELQREVALKEILPGQANVSECRERFVLEAEITGRLEHPGIVPVYGLGLSADGRPFYAMRFIQGQSLEAALAEFHRTDRGDAPFSPARAFELRQLLNRLVAVCNAIDFAHSRGVIHRDLKPANIMLGEYGESLVVDWGMAKVLLRAAADKSEQIDGIASEESSSPAASVAVEAGTQENTIFGTPHYMSPEQAAGQISRLGVVSDVYSLGATLYQLLTGKKPFSGETLPRILAAVQHGEFVAPRRIIPAIPRSLEAICFKAMATLPEDRYTSARQLGDDLEHWLADEPVLAYVDSWATKALRFARRHRAWVQAATVGVLMVAVISTVSVAVINEARQRAEINEAKAITAHQATLLAKEEETRQRQAAQESARQARAATEFLVNMFAAGDAVLGLKGSGFRRPEDREQPLSARDLLDRGRQRVTEELGREPLIRASLLDALGISFLSLGDFATAQPLLEESLHIRTERLAPAHPDVLASQMSLGIWKHFEGDFDAAEKLFRDVLAFQQQSSDTDPLVMARTKLHLGWMLGEQLRPEANKLLRECLAIRREQLGDKHRDVLLVQTLLAGNRYSQGSGDPQLTDLLGLLQDAPKEVGPLLVTGMLKFNQITAHRTRRQYTEAIALYQSLLADSRRVLGADHPLHFAMQFDLAGLHHQLGDFSTAETVSREALTRAARIIGSNPRLAEVHFKLAQLLKDRGDDAEAEFHFREAIRVGRRVSNNPWEQRAAAELCAWKISLGKFQELDPGEGDSQLEFLLEMGRTADAVRLAQPQFDETWPRRATWPHSVNAVYWTQILTRCLRSHGDFSAARRIEAETLEFVRPLVPQFKFEPNSASRSDLRRFASFLEEQSEFELAEKLFRLALEVDRAIDVPRHPDLARAIIAVAVFLRDHGDVDEAIKLFEEALEIQRSRLGIEHLETTTTLLDLALARQKHGDGEEAMRLAHEVRAIRLRRFGAEDARTMAAVRNLATILGQNKRFSEAEVLLRDSLAIYVRVLPATHSHIWQSVLELGDLLTAQQNYEAASNFYEDALRDMLKAWSPNSWQLAEVTSRLGNAQSELKRFDEAGPLLRRSLETLRAAWGTSHERCRQALRRTMRHFETVGNLAEADRLRREYSVKHDNSNH